VSSLRGNPYWVFSRLRFREAILRAYIVREHARGRPLVQILEDPYLTRYAPGVCARVLQHPLTIAALERNDVEAISACSEQLAG